MKVLCVNPFINPLSGGGTAERTVKLAKHLQLKGIDTCIFSSNYDLQGKFYEQADLPKIIAVKLINIRYQIPLVELDLLSNLIKSIDIVHLMNHWTSFNAIVYVLCRVFKKPYVMCPAGALPIFGRSYLFKRFYNFTIGHKIIQNASAHIAITEDEAKQFSKFGVDPSSVTVIPNGISPGEFENKNTIKFREKYDLADHPIILFVGRLNYIKGPDLLLEAFAEIKTQYPNYILVFSGPDEGMKERLKRLSKIKNIENSIRFTGYIDGITKSQAYHAADLLVVPSRQEAMSIVALEAGCTGTPVLLTDACGFEKVEKIKGGLIVEASIEGIRNGLNRLLKDEKVMKDMGLKLKMHVLEEYTWNSIVEKHIELFNSIIP